MPAGEIEEPDKAGGVRAVERAITIVNVLAEQRQPMSVGDIASRMKLNPATVHRLLGTLLGTGWVEQDPDTSRYRMGTQLAGVGAAAIASSALVQAGEELLARLAELSGGNAYLSVLIGRRVTYLARAAGKLGPSVFSNFQPGSISHPAHAMADGKVALAYLSPAERDAFFDCEPLRRYTPATLVSRGDIERELQVIVERRYAVDRGERYDFQRGVAVPVFGPRGNVLAMMLTWGRIDLTPELEEWLSQEMTILSEELTYRLGPVAD